MQVLARTRFSRARRGLQRRLSWVARRVYLGFSLASLLLLAAPAGASALAVPFASLAFIAFLALWFTGLVVGGARASLGTARLDGDTLHLEADGVHHALRADALREGSVRADIGRWSLRVRDHHGDEFDVAVPDEAMATAWLDALGLDASRRTMRLVSDRTLAQWAFAYFFGGFFAAPFMIFAMGLLALLGVDPLHASSIAVAYLGIGPGYWLAARTIGHVDVSVGADGVRAGRGFARRFFPVASIVGAEVAVTTLHLRLASGAVERYRFDRGDDAEAVARRVNEVVALHRSPASALPAALLTTESLSAAQWRDRFVHALREEGYRASAFTRDDLTRLVNAKDVPAPQRLGAALALHDVAPAEGVTGVRIAAGAMVDPDLPRVLEAAAPATAMARAAGR
ncbi:MAG: hypothetical protein U0325_10090 [Polyangiales bacterium]